MAEPAKCHLLSLPAELRARIYEYALVSDEPIVIDYHKLQEAPALLRTCRQIHTEASSVFYSNNHFRAIVCGYDGCELVPFRRSQLQYRAKTVQDNYSVTVCDDSLCRKVYLHHLERWAHAYHADPIVVPGLEQDARAEPTREMTVARRTFGVVDAMRNRPWVEVKRVLEDFYSIIQFMQENEDH